MNVNNVPDASGPTVNTLWRTLVVGLMALILISLVFIGILLLRGIDPGVLVTFATAALTGLIGLFVPPAAKSEE